MDDLNREDLFEHEPKPSVVCFCLCLVCVCVVCVSPLFLMSFFFYLSFTLNFLFVSGVNFILLFAFE